MEVHPDAKCNTAHIPVDEQNARSLDQMDEVQRNDINWIAEYLADIIDDVASPTLDTPRRIRAHAKIISAYVDDMANRIEASED